MLKFNRLGTGGKPNFLKTGGKVASVLLFLLNATLSFGQMNIKNIPQEITETLEKAGYTLIGNTYTIKPNNDGSITITGSMARLGVSCKSATIKEIPTQKTKTTGTGSEPEPEKTTKPGSETEKTTEPELKKEEKELLEKIFPGENPDSYTIKTEYRQDGLYITIETNTLASYTFHLDEKCNKKKSGHITKKRW